jgi:WD40 repeat protein
MSRPSSLRTYAGELGLPAEKAEAALDRIFYWTGGQPYLSQKLARAISREQISSSINEDIDRIAIQQLAGRAAISSEPHLSHIHRVLRDDRKNQDALLTLYGQLRKGIAVAHDPESRIQRRLRAIGLVVVDSDNNLKVRNRIYEAVFTARWANENLPMHWRGPAMAVALLLALTAIPFAYTQLLPKPYLSIMANPVLDLGTVSDAYVNLRSFPGHADSADRMFRSVLENRARLATDRESILQIVRFASQLDEDARFAANLRAEFWDRQTERALQSERRDDALLASLEALVIPTQERRRRAATLVGGDYAVLHATVPALQAEGVVLDRDSMQLSYYDGAQIFQWLPGEQGLQAREPWTISALEIAPLVRRVIVDREGVANRIGLTINVSHARLADLNVKLIAPSGRTAEFMFDAPSSAANEEIRIDRSLFSPLIGEELSGTWSLSVRDESTGVTGHLVSWNLSLNSQVVVESFDRGLDIPDPQERPSENTWFSSNGRHAIARALQSDSARLWDLRFAQAARTIAVPASERVLGLSANAEFLVTVAQDTVNLWRTADGRRHATLAVGTVAAEPVMSRDGLHLLVQSRNDVNTVFRLWSIARAAVIAELTIAGAPALIAMKAVASHIAIADYDRAARVWNLRSGALLSQHDLAAQPTEIALSANGESLAAIHGDQGVSLWLTGRPGLPVLQKWGTNEWHMAFSASGARIIVGNHREGFQAYNTVDGTPSGPLLDAGLKAGAQELLAFSSSEEFVITASPDGVGRYWKIPAIAANLVEAPATSGNAVHAIWHESGDLVSALAPGGERIAVGDGSGHVHIQQAESGSTRIDGSVEDLSFLGHRAAVTGMEFSNDGALVASAASDGSIRIWDANSGLPREFYTSPSAGAIETMAFSPSGSLLAVLSGQRLWMIDAQTGDVRTDIALGSLYRTLSFARNEQIYLGAENGALQSLDADRAGNWHLRGVWQGAAAVRGLVVSPARQLLVVVDSMNRARLLDTADGNIGAAVLELPDPVVDIAFSPSESRVVFRTARWVHRALVSPGGLVWTDTLRAPTALGGSRMVFDPQYDAAADAGHVSDPSGDRLLILTRDSGFAEIAELRFSYQSGPTLFGNRSELLAEWSEKLAGPAPNVFDREGF